MAAFNVNPLVSSQAVRARFDETATELALIADATGIQDVTADRDVLEAELRTALGDVGVAPAVASVLSQVGATAAGQRPVVGRTLSTTPHRPSRAAARHPCADPPRRISCGSLASCSLLVPSPTWCWQMKAAPLTERLGMGFEGLRLLNELNGFVGEVIAELRAAQRA